MATHSIELSAAHEKGLGLYVEVLPPVKDDERTEDQKKSDALNFLIHTSLESFLRIKYKEQNDNKTPEEMADSLA